ncbi:MAG TPA: 30S ribosomal protein S15 [Candidatus Saccharimonadales bacterium]|nr:30S ribosomal protein S15 [Candidatus Saccharimonadales bacterium]
MITKETKAKVIADVKLHPTDVGSVQAQVAIISQRIADITVHLKANKQDIHGRRGLLKLVGQRKRLLKYLQEKDFGAYKSLITKLGLRK